MRWLTFVTLLSAALTQAQPMTSPKSESEALLNAALPFAEQLLAQYGEFFPYAHAMDESGKFIFVAASDRRDRPPSKELIGVLKEGLQTGARAGKYKATALVYDVRITLPESGVKSDAIAVSLNHKANYAVLLFFPYRLEGKKVVTGEPLAQAEENYAFSTKQ